MGARQGGFEPLTFLQTSDWYVGTPLAGREPRWPEDLRAARRAEIDGVANRLVEAAKLASAQAVFLPGNLWDATSATPANIETLLECFAALSPCPVFIAPGTVDPVEPGSFHDPALLGALSLRPWPENVILFRSADWTSVRCPGRADVFVTGRASLGSSPDFDSIHNLVKSAVGADENVDREGDVCRILLSFAGAPRREDYLSTDFDWCALGGAGRHTTLGARPGVDRVLGAYAGAATARDFNDAGVFLKVTLDENRTASFEAIPADPKRLHDLRLDVSGLSFTAIRDAAIGVIAKASVSSADVVRLTLAGERGVEERSESGYVPLRDLLKPASDTDPCFSAWPVEIRPALVLVRDLTNPEADPELRFRTAEGRFVSGLGQRLLSSTEEDESRVLRLALEFGRGALHGRAPRPLTAEEI